MSYFDCEQERTVPIAGMEAINYQPDNSLATELEEFFQDLSDRVNSYTKSNTSTPEAWINIIIKEFGIGGWYSTRLQKILHKNVGIDKITFMPDKAPCITPLDITGYNPLVAIGIADEMSIHRDQGRVAHSGVFPFEGIFTGTSPLAELIRNGVKYHKPTQQSVSELLQILKQIGQSYDPKTGKFGISSGNFGKMQYSLSCHIGFPIKQIAVSLITDTEYRANNFLEFVEYMTPREWTAVYLHEVGHLYETYQAFSTEYIMADVTLRTAALSNSNTNKNYNTGETYKTFAETFRALNRGNTDIISSKITNIGIAAMEVADKVNNLKKVINESSPMASMIDTFIKYCELIGLAVEQLINVRMKLITALILLNTATPAVALLGIFDLLNLVYRVMHDDYTVTPTVSGRKTSDQALNPWSLSVGERAADAVAVRFGYGAELISAISKLAPTIYASPFTKISQVPYCRIAILNTVMHVLSVLISGMMGILLGEDIVHNEGIQRIKSVLSDHYRFLAICKNDPNLDDNYVKRMIVNTDLLRKQLENAKDNLFNNPQIKLASLFLQWIVNPEKLISFIINGQVPDDYLKLHRQVEQITHSNLYYWSAKLNPNE